MSSLIEEIIYILIQHKIIFITTFLLILCKKLLFNLIVDRIYKKNQCVNKISTIESIPMTPEEKKIYDLTQCNTIVNREMLDKRDLYLKKVELNYMEIYGEKGLKFFNSILNDKKSNPKKSRKVQFSNDIIYSRN